VAVLNRNEWPVSPEYPIKEGFKLIDPFPHEPAVNHKYHFAHGLFLKNKAPWSILAFLLVARMSQGAFCKLLY
jgi:hypothetical protein